MRDHGPKASRRWALLFGAGEDNASMLEQLAGWESPALPLTGGDLNARGMEPGPMVSETLARFEQQWVENGFRMEGVET